MAQQTIPNRRRVLPVRGAGGATLIELLAVIIIMTMLAAAALPVIAPAMQNRQVREAARIVNGFLTGARNRAMQTGRPVGVVFERMQGLPEACVTMSYAEVPTPYAGDFVGSNALLAGNTIKALTPQYDGNMPPNLIGSADIGWISTVRPGDLIKFNYVGHTFQILGAVDTSTGKSIPPDAQGFFTATASPGPNCIWTLAPLPTTPNATPPTGGSPKYQIFRAPIRMAAGSVQLPGTAVIDLTCSGFDLPTPLVDFSTGYPISPWSLSFSFQPLPDKIGSYPTFASGGADTSNVMLTFGPSGAVDRIWCWQNTIIPFGAPDPPNTTPPQSPTIVAFRPTQAIHLMVGQREYLPLPAAPPAITDPNANGFKPFVNWQDVGNFWVTINPQSGLITTTEVLQAPSFTTKTSPYTQYGDYYTEFEASRKLARDAISMGGR